MLYNNESLLEDLIVGIIKVERAKDLKNKIYFKFHLL